MSSRNLPPRALPINMTPPLPPALPIEAEVPPPLLPLTQTKLSNRSSSFVPALTDISTIKTNMDDWQIPQFKERMEQLELQLQSQTQNFTRNLKIEMYISKFALIAMNDARKMQNSLKNAGLTTDKQKAIDEVVAAFVKELHAIKAKNLSAPLTKQLIQILDEKAKLDIKNIETPAGLLPAIKQIYFEIFKMLMTVGIQGVFKLGKMLQRHKAILAKGTDQAYISAYWIISSYLFSTLSSFLLYMLNPAFYEGDMRSYMYGKANITELGGARRRKHRTQKRKTKKPHKTNKRNWRK